MSVRRAMREGYSLLEVMVAVAILIIGATGLVLMQGTTTRGNLKAQQTTIAATMAQTWVERLKRESRGWQNVGWPNNSVITPNLEHAVDEPYAPSPTFVGSGESAWMDAFGFDTTVPDQARFFVRLVNHTVHQDDVLNTDLMRVDVTVYWFRSVYGANDPDVSDRAPPGFDPPSPGVVASDALLESPLTNKVYASILLQRGGP